MKFGAKIIYYFLLANVLFILVLEPLGIELTTVKGSWKSEKFKNNEYCIMQFDNNRFTLYEMNTDSTYSNRIEGSWVNKKDTISLYSQDKGFNDVIIKQMSMNTMTIQAENKYIVMSRIYRPNTDDYFAKTMEVLELKSKLWYWFTVIGGLIFGLGAIYALTEIIKSTIKIIKNLWYKHQNKSDK